MRTLIAVALAAAQISTWSAAFADEIAATPAMEAVAKNSIRQILKDPDSAKWGQIRAFQTDGKVEVCGMVNAKNSYGGYAGSVPFHVVLTKEWKAWSASDPDMSDPQTPGYFYQFYPACAPLNPYAQ